MQIQNVPITKGPDKFRLMESLFHEVDVPFEDPVILSFTAEHEGREYKVSVRTRSISRQIDGRGTYLIEGVAHVRERREEKKTALELMPVKISYSVETRRGFASVNF